MPLTPFGRATGLTLLTILAVTPSARAQQPLPLLGVDVDLGEYGIGGAEQVRRGRVSVAYAPDGPRLTTYFLRDTPPPRRGAPAAPRPPAAPAEAPDAGSGRALQRALWVWNTEELLGDPRERGAFLDFVAAQGITRVFLYLPAARGERPVAGYIPFDGARVGPLLAELRARGALAYALDGDKDYVRPENHAGVYRTVERIVAHNRSVPEGQRFHGVRYDIEPYLSPGFQGPRRAEILDGYVELVAGIAERAHAGGLAVAVDVPFWLDAPDEETGAYLEATLHGAHRRVLEHVMALVDDIAVMDYRTVAEGPNGALAHASGELALGADAGVGVYVGVETTRLLDEDLHTFFGPPAEGLPTRGDARWIVLEGRGGGHARLWLVDSAEALAELAGRVEPSSVLRHWPAGRPARVAADAQSFHNLGAGPMERVAREVVAGFSGRAAFLGLAYHDYVGLKELLGRR